MNRNPNKIFCIKTINKTNPIIPVGHLNNLIPSWMIKKVQSNSSVKLRNPIKQYKSQVFVQQNLMIINPKTIIITIRRNGNGTITSLNDLLLIKIEVVSLDDWFYAWLDEPLFVEFKTQVVPLNIIPYGQSVRH